MKIVLKFQLPSLLRIGSYDVLQIWRKSISDRISESMNHIGVCRRASATPGLLNMSSILNQNISDFGRKEKRISYVTFLHTKSTHVVTIKVLL